MVEREVERMGEMWEGGQRRAVLCEGLQICVLKWPHVVVSRAKRYDIIKRLIVLRSL